MVVLVEDLLDSGGDRLLPEVLLVDKAYDDDKLREALEARGVRMLSPHRENRVNSPRRRRLRERNPLQLEPIS